MHTIVNPDPKPLGPIRDPDLLRSLHLEWKECALCRGIGLPLADTLNPENLMYIGLSLHHINKHPRDDVRGNLVMLCGHGTAGCHGRVEAADPGTLQNLGQHILSVRGDTIAYLYERLGSVAAREFLETRLLV